MGQCHQKLLLSTSECGGQTSAKNSKQNNYFKADKACLGCLHFSAAVAKKTFAFEKHFKMSSFICYLEDTYMLRSPRKRACFLTPQVKHICLHYPSLLLWSEILMESQRSRVLKQKIQDREFSTVICCIAMFQSMLDRIYLDGPLKL